MKTIVINLLLVTFLISCSTAKEQKTNQTLDTKPFTAEVKHSMYIEYDNINDPQKMHVVLDNDRMLIEKSGKIIGSKGELYLDLGLEGDIQRIWMWKDGPELTVVTELSDTDNGWSQVMKMNVMQKTKMWSTRFGGFNAGEPILVEGKLYLSTIGTIAKMDQSTGTFCWKIENLYDGSQYNGFEEPVFVNAEQILFRSDRPFVDKMDEILVDDAKGTILRKD